MKFATFFDADNTEQIGAVINDEIHSLHDLGFQYADITDFIAAYTPTIGKAVAAKAAAGKGVPAATTRLQAPIPRPRHDILCIGQNYLAHALESAAYAGKEYVKPKRPMYFSKRAGLPVGQDGFIPAHADITEKLDYETELAVVVGKRMDHVPPEKIFEHVFGYTIVNDVSARDRQSEHVQFTYGKGMDGFAPMGPWIVTADEFAAPPHIRIQTRVNGEPRQDSNTDDFIFGIPHLLSELSSAMVLEPGDILLTGTPAGVGMGFRPPKFLKPGDAVECEIEGIGVLRNTVK